MIKSRALSSLPTRHAGPPLGARAQGLLLALALTFAAARAAADDAPPEPAPPPAPAEPKAPPPPAEPPPAEPTAPAEPKAPPASKGFVRRYIEYFDRKVDEVQKLDLYGVSATIPEGVLKLRYEYNPARAREFFDRQGHRTRLLPTISLTGFPQATDQLAIDPVVAGRGASHTFALSYGLTDRIEPFVEVPFMEVHSSLDLQLSKNGQALNEFDRSLFVAYVESNGRPAPGGSYDGKLNLSNISTGVSWNFHRTPTFSAAVVPRVIFPTGRQADPNNDLTFLRGPEVDRGIPAWGVQVAHQFDVRPLRWLVLNAELSATYRFRYSRRAPRWNALSDCRRVQDPSRRASLGCGAAVPYSREYDLSQTEFFPDMSGLDPTYHVTPGLSEQLSVGFTLAPIPVPVQAVYIFQHNEAPAIEGSGAGDSGPAFERQIQQFGLQLASTLHTVGVGVTVPLFPIYVPVRVTLSGKWTFAGANTIVLTDNYSIAFELFLPAGDAFSKSKGAAR